MKKVMPLLIFLMLIGLFQSCDKDETLENTSPTINQSSGINTVTADYLPDADSSYWVYQITQTDTTGTISNLLGFDTMLVTSQTLSGKSYKQYRFKLFPSVSRYDFWYMRDSSGVFVNEFGDVVLDINQLNSVIRTDTLIQCYYFQYSMLNNISTVTVPLGTYNDLVNYQTRFQFSPCPPPNGLPSQRIWNRLFANGVGLVYESYGLTNDPSVWLYERKLVAYQINN